MEYKPNLEFKNRVEMVKTANNVIKNCAKIWTSRKPFSPEYFEDVKTSLEELERSLDEIKELPINLGPTSLDERIKYHESLLAIPKKYLKVIEKHTSKRRNPFLYFFKKEMNEDYENMYLADLSLALIGLNDLGMGIINAEKIKNGEITLERLNEKAEETILTSQKYLVRGERIPSKKPRYIAELTWSALYILNPITETDENVIYEKLVIGNFRSWQTFYERRWWLTRSYLPSLRKRYRTIINGYLNNQCYPEQLLILISPELVNLIIKKRSTEKIWKPYIA
jgi:hypothetical protein